MTTEICNCQRYKPVQIYSFLNQLDLSDKTKKKKNYNIHSLFSNTIAYSELFSVTSISYSKLFSNFLKMYSSTYVKLKQPTPFPIHTYSRLNTTLQSTNNRTYAIITIYKKDFNKVFQM